MPDETLVRHHFEHYIKLLELFETRQTWTFNFAILVYAAAIAGCGTLMEKALLPAFQKPKGSPEGDVSVAAFCVLCSVVLPLVILPLCYLFVDVSIYCAAMNMGYREY